MNLKDVTKKMLADVCDDFNRVMKYGTPIPTDPADKKVTKATLENDIREAAIDLVIADLKADPKDLEHIFLTPETIEVLTIMKIQLPEEPVKAPSATNRAKKPSSTDFVMKYVCDHPEATDEDVVNALSAAGLKALSPITLGGWVKSTKDVIAYLKETRKIK